MLYKIGLNAGQLSADDGAGAQKTLIVGVAVACADNRILGLTANASITSRKHDCRACDTCRHATPKRTST